MTHDHDPGLAHDLALLNERASRRRMALAWLASIAGFGSLTVLGCGGGGGGDNTSTAGGNTSTGGSTGTTTTTTTTGSCAVIPEETNGPYPADGSNSASGGIANVLLQSGIVRSDIRSSFGSSSSSTQAGGVPLAVTLKLVNASASSSCADLSGYAIYIWHCDREGRYSMYSSGVTAENYLRGVQVTGSDGTVTFTTVFPACYSGRMPHIHIEVYASAAAATSYTKALKTTQLAFPTDVCNTVYNGASGYSASITNFARISFSSDMVFGDGVTQELATVTGDLTNGYAATLTVGVAA